MKSKLIIFCSYSLFVISISFISNLSFATTMPPNPLSGEESVTTFSPPAKSLCDVLLAPVTTRQRIEIPLGKYVPMLRAPGQGYWKYEKKLPLESPEGELRIGFWGVGSAFSDRQFQSNFIVVKGKTKVQVDLGNKTTIKMQEFGVSVEDVKDIVITHSHADHAGSLEEKALKSRYKETIMQAFKEGFNPQKDYAAFAKRVKELKNDRSFKPNLYIPRHYEPILWGQSLQGGLAASEEPEDGKGLTLPDYFNVVNPKLIHTYNRSAWSQRIGTGKDQIRFEFFVVPHIPDTASLEDLDKSFYTVGMIIDGKVLISGDTRFDPKLFLDLAGPLRGVDTIFHDGQSFPGGVHAHIAQLDTLLPDHIKSRLFIYHTDDGLRPLVKVLGPDGKPIMDEHGNEVEVLGGQHFIEKGKFAGFAEPLPVMYAWPVSHDASEKPVKAEDIDADAPAGRVIGDGSIK